jgi:hypothetical protein
MPRYLVIGHGTWLRTPNEAAERMQEVGSIIEFSGEPGESLYPVDDAAREATRKVLWRRTAGQRKMHDLAVRRFKAVLPRAARAILDEHMPLFAAFLDAADKRGKNMQP